MNLDTPPFSAPYPAAGQDTVTIRLFGALRQFHIDSNLIDINTRGLTLIGQLRARIAEKFAEAGKEQILNPILASSVFANSEGVLTDEAPIPYNEELALLPPVCGG